MFLEFAAWLQSTSASLTIQTVVWIIPFVQSIHILTIGIVFVSILSITLRILEMAWTDEPFGTVLRRFSPWIGYGLIVMALTGIVLVVGEPLREFMALSFWLKMSLLVIGVSSAAAFRHALRARDEVNTTTFGTSAKTMAVATVLLWICIIYLGRTIAYDVEVWGSLSLAAEPQAAQTAE